MPLPLIAVLYPLIKAAVVKWAVGRIATALAHKPAQAAATFAHQVGTNAVVAAADAPTATAAISTLCRPGKSAKRLADKVVSIQSEEELRTMMRLDQFTQEEKIEALALAVTLTLFEQLLARQKRRRVTSSQKTPKTKVTHLEPCAVSECKTASGKPCVDFRPAERGASSGCCCDHGRTSHQRITGYQLTEATTLEYIFTQVAEDLYGAYGHHAPGGEPKEHLQEISPCGRCPCADFDLERKGLFTGTRCYCGHRDRDHSSFPMFSAMVPSNYSWVVGTAVADIIEESNLDAALS